MYCIDCMVSSKVEDLGEYTINRILTDFFKLCECTPVSSVHVLSAEKSKMAEDLTHYFLVMYSFMFWPPYYMIAPKNYLFIYLFIVFVIISTSSNSTRSRSLSR